MQVSEMSDKQVVQLLQQIEKRLAQANPTFDELPKDEQRYLFLRAVENASLTEIIELEATHPDLIAIQQEREENARKAAIASAKAAGLRLDDDVERIMAQFESDKK